MLIEPGIRTRLAVTAPGLLRPTGGINDSCFQPRKPEIARLLLRLPLPVLRLSSTVLEKSGENWFQD